MNAKDFLNSIQNEHFIKRDELCRQYAIDNKCSINNFKPVTINDNKNKLTYIVSNNYLSFENIIIPLSAPRAQELMDSCYCTLPTKMMVDQIWKAAQIKVKQISKGPPYDSSMFSIKEIIRNSELINIELSGKDTTQLIAGHKKDVVITNKLAPNNPNKRVAIYGWHGTNGIPIQGPGINSSSHERDYYYDYSHGIRLVSRDCILNDEVKDILEVLSSNEYSYLISDEGRLNFLKY